jgi:hypothetical protein
MTYHLIQHPTNPYLETLPGDGQIAGEQDALDLIGACGEYGIPRLMLHAENLPEDFYDLCSGLAGALLLKFSNYRIKVAAVLPPERANQGRFGEMALEANRSNRGFHIFPDRPSAEAWLVK